MTLIAYGRILVVLVFTTVLNIPAALSAESSYSKLDFDRHCRFKQPASDEEAGMGGSAICKIGNAPVVYFQEGDLRQSVGFGAPKPFQTFGQFNQMNTTIEWRSDGQRAYAAIVRWFIENLNLETGMVDKAHKGQVLVVHRVAATIDDMTCIVGLVDARANSNANQLARKIADEMARNFNCANDRAEYHGERGRFSGDLSLP